MTYGRAARDDLHRSVDAFEVSLRELAWQLAARVIADELSRRPAEPRRRRPPRAKAPPVRVQVATAVPAAPDGKRVRWTRETVVAELCEWLISGIVEPAFLRRHGKPGLVPAATRIFGRFDSALNVANLYLAKQYPDGPPSKRNAPAQPRVPQKPRAARSSSRDTSGAALASGSDPQIAMPPAVATDAPGIAANDLTARELAASETAAGENVPAPVREVARSRHD